jgi:phenylalanyl-tRNA synthetase alpha chain
MAIDDKTSLDLDTLLAGGDTVEGLYSELRSSFDAEKSAVTSEDQLKAFRDRWAGRKNGLLTHANDHWLKKAPREFKPQVGRLQNDAKKYIEAGLANAKSNLGQKEEGGGGIDVTLPGPPRLIGAPHPVQLVFDEVESIFHGLGYSVGEGPEIESFYYNFEALNFPADHPAVDEMDTLFLKDGSLLRTHTSPNQIRIMEAAKPPLRYLVPGKVYRNDTADSTHSPMFHQIEGFAVDRDITFSDLKGTLDYFLRRFFGQDTRIRFRPSFFPFTEPSAEVDIYWEGRGFIEVLGCGMIDPGVFRHVGYDPEEYSGFAFGLGIDRFAMLKYDITDIQLLFQGDARFLRQFR